MLGYQKWDNGRLVQLSLDGWNIRQVPKSIRQLSSLYYLNLNNNSISEGLNILENTSDFNFMTWEDRHSDFLKWLEKNQRT